MADPLDFADPFWGQSSEESNTTDVSQNWSYTSTPTKLTLSGKDLAIKSTTSSAFKSIPYLSNQVDSFPDNWREYIFPDPDRDGSSLSEDELVSVSELKVVGQGTIAVKTTASKSIEFLVSQKSQDQKNSFPKLCLKITQTEAFFTKKTKDGEIRFPKEDVIWTRPEASQYIPSPSPPSGTVYWFSIDRSNSLLRYGKYYTSNAMTLREMKLKPESTKWFVGFNVVEVKTDNDVGISNPYILYIAKRG